MTASRTAVVRLATRGSALARAQAALTAQALGAAGVTIEVMVVRTTGDRRQDVPVAEMEGQGWFTAELERALLDGRAGAAVHSAKDLPTRLAPGLVIAAHLPRADPRDALVAAGGAGLDGLPAGARVGTSSPRREAFVRALRPDLTVVPMRGNVDTRLRRLDEGAVDALLLACAGLDRLGLGDRISERLDPERFVPAPAQGVVAVETRSGSSEADVCGQIADPVAAAAVTAERAVLVRLGAGCRLPLGAWARVDGARLVLVAALAEGTGIRRTEVTGAVEEAEALGAAAAARLA